MEIFSYCDLFKIKNWTGKHIDEKNKEKILNNKSTKLSV